MDQNRFMNFSFTFEEGGRKSSWALDTKNELRWEVVGYRGAPDKDCADVDVFFGGRNLFFGEGLVIQSPVDVSTHVGTPMPTEDDVLHADELPDFSGTLSRDESEMLFSYLVVDYARIPLILNFFSEKDRVTYLINEELQSLLLATLFESGPSVSSWTNFTSRLLSLVCECICFTFFAISGINIRLILTSSTT